MYKYLTTNNLSIALFFSAAAWGLFWIPLRQVEALGISGSWTVVIFNAIPLIVLIPIFLLTFKKYDALFRPTIYSAIFIGLAITFYSKGLVETSVVRATLLFYLTPIWSTIFGIIWLSENLTLTRIISIIIAFLGMFLLLSSTNNSVQPLNIGDLYGFLSGIFWGLGATFIKRWSKMSVVTLATLCFIFTTIYSSFFAIFIYNEAFPILSLVKLSIPIMFFWSIILLLPSFCTIFFVSKFLYPGRVAILMMSEVIVAVISASLLIPEEKMFLIQWIGAWAIIFAGLYEVVFSEKKFLKKEI